MNPGWSTSRPFSAVLNAEVSDDAAKTVIDPLSGSGDAEGPLDGLEPHAVSAVAVVPNSRRVRVRIFMVASVVVY